MSALRNMSQDHRFIPQETGAKMPASANLEGWVAAPGPGTGEAPAFAVAPPQEVPETAVLLPRGAAGPRCPY